MYLTPRQVAQRLNVSPRTVYLWIASGRLPAVHVSERVTRIDEAAVDALVPTAVRATYPEPGLSQPDSAYVAAESAPVCCLRCGATVDPSDRRPPTVRLRELVARNADGLKRIAAARGGSNVRIFGSVARGDAHYGSDVDFLIDLVPGATLFDLGGIQYGFQELLGCNVDVTPSDGLTGSTRERVLSEAVPV